jgi:hypothetical protein
VKRWLHIALVRAVLWSVIWLALVWYRLWGKSRGAARLEVSSWMTTALAIDKAETASAGGLTRAGPTDSSRALPWLARPSEEASAMPLSADALQGISDRNASYGGILVARLKALDERCDAAESLPTRARDAAFAEIELESTKLQKHSRRHEERAGRWIKRISQEVKAPPPSKQR